MGWQDDGNTGDLSKPRRDAANVLAAQQAALRGDTATVNFYLTNPYSGVTSANLTPEALANEKYHMEHPTGNALNFFKDMVIPAAAIWGGGYLGATALGAGAGAGAAGVGDAAIAGGVGTDALAGGATEALGGGLTAGSTAGGIGAGATGTGLTAGTTAAGIGEGAVGTGLAGSAATGVLAPGYFAAESAYPVIGGTTTAALGGAAGGAAAGGLGSALGGLTAADLLRGVPGVLGALAAKNQTDQLTGLAHEYMALGAPSRGRYEASYAPGFTMNNDPGYLDALNQSAKATLHGLSVTGNPADSPNAWAKSLQDLYEKSAYPALQNYRTTNAGAGGLAALTSAAPTTSTAAINSNANVANGLGVAAADIFTPRQSLADILKSLR